MILIGVIASGAKQSSQVFSFYAPWQTKPLTASANFVMHRLKQLLYLPGLLRSARNDARSYGSIPQKRF
jgi:hypothetical protein